MRPTLKRVSEYYVAAPIDWAGGRLPATSALDSVYSVPCISSASGETRNETLVRSAAAKPLLAHSFEKLRIAPTGVPIAL